MIEGSLVEENRENLVNREEKTFRLKGENDRKGKIEIQEAFTSTRSERINGLLVKIFVKTRRKRGVALREVLFSMIS